MKIFKIFMVLMVSVFGFILLGFSTVNPESQPDTAPEMAIALENNDPAEAVPISLYGNWQTFTTKDGLPSDIGKPAIDPHPKLPRLGFTFRLLGECTGQRNEDYNQNGKQQ